MARAIWSGSVAFGLVNVPVGLYAATDERTGREVDLAHMVRGHEVGDGQCVLLSDEELEAVGPAGPGRLTSPTSPTSTRSIRTSPT